VISVDIATQTLTLLQDAQPVLSYPVSTSAQGAGCEAGSFKTPVGWHRVRAKVGDGCPLGAVFVGRRPTREVFSADLGRNAPQRDWVLTRILWLQGLEPGLNRGGKVDTLRRYIYIHGTPDQGMEDPPASHGCVRMYNEHVVDLFSRVRVGTPVLITPGERRSSHAAARPDA
jgi:lipoprotein-anchoring transpeptidase ErfK/SrfK